MGHTIHIGWNEKPYGVWIVFLLLDVLSVRARRRVGRAAYAHSRENERSGERKERLNGGE